MELRAALVAILVLGPMLGSMGCVIFRARIVRNALVLATGLVLILSALRLCPLVPFQLVPDRSLGVDLHHIARLVCILLPMIFLTFGLRHKHGLIIALAGVQLLLECYLEFYLIRAAFGSVQIRCDTLSLIMVSIISIVGAVICFQAIAYMHHHEIHHPAGRSGQPRFFAVMLLFLGAMNGLVLFNNLVFVYLFFEVTTLCSFLLIGHDRTHLAIRNALKALWMNCLGGVFFVLGLIIIYHQVGALPLDKLSVPAPGRSVSTLALALLCTAALIKSAQFPFQSWLLGAMVAPTPVSALLHSSTMVKVGVYLVLRLAAGFAGTFLSKSLAVFGAFGFLAAAGLAVGQRNGKKVLAYSTISNLGLIFACCGVNSSEALAAAALLLVFHAIIKAMLFLSVGAIEQSIASRDIEDMRGLYAVMPVTALITVAGVVMMIMPPFGVLLGKWMAMEAAAPNLAVILMIVLGSALTVMYWARWAGTLMSDPFAGRFRPEKQPLLTWLALGPLCAGAGLLSVAAPWFYRRLITPLLADGLHTATYTTIDGVLENAWGSFAVLPLSLVALLGFGVAVLALKKAFGARIVPAYMSGIQAGEPAMFVGPMNRLVKAQARNYYLDAIFGEDKLTRWINLGAAILLALIIGGAL